MSVHARIAFGAASSWISRGVTILLGMLLMPVLFHHLQREELGVWLLLGQSWAVLGVLDFGLACTLTRRIAFAVGKSGADLGAPLSPESIREIADLATTGRIAYRALAAGAFVFAFVAGCLSLRGLHLSGVSMSGVWIAWGVLCLSQAVTVWAAVWTCLLQGVGYVGWDALVAALTSSLTLAAQIVTALAGGGLIGLAIAAAAGALLQRFLILGLARRKRPELFSIRGSWRPGLLRGMAPLALKAWITALGGVVAMNSDQWFIAGMQGARQIPAYRAAYLVFLNLEVLAVTYGGNASVFIARLWQAGATSEVHRIVTVNLRLGLSIMAAGGACVLALGPHFFNIWLGHGNYIGAPVAVVFFVVLFLEAQSYIIATSSRATEDEAFAVWSAAAAGIKIVASLLLGSRFGLIGIALGTLLAQGLTNHWFMCYRGLQRLRLSLSDHLRETLGPVACLFALTFGMVRTLAGALSGASDVKVVLTCAAASVSVLGAACWYSVLNKDQRKLATVILRRLFRLPKRLEVCGSTEQ